MPTGSPCSPKYPSSPPHPLPQHIPSAHIDPHPNDPSHIPTPPLVVNNSLYCSADQQKLFDLKYVYSQVNPRVHCDSAEGELVLLKYRSLFFSFCECPSPPSRKVSSIRMKPLRWTPNAKSCQHLSYFEMKIDSF